MALTEGGDAVALGRRLGETMVGLGINAFIAEQPLPPEFALLRYKPEPWGLADTAAIGTVLAWITYEIVFWINSIEMPSGDLTKAMWPSLGGRLIVTPASMSFWHSS